jgi:CRP-like cAMP-binding protein
MEGWQMDRRQESLDGIEIFGVLSPEARRSWASRCTWRDFKPRQQIVGHQEASRNVFFLTSGKARPTIYSVGGKQVTFRDINAGEMFGEWAAIDGEPRSASVEAVTRCIVAAMSPDNFWELLRSEPSVMAAVLKRLTRQVRNLSHKVSELSTLAVRKRIQAELLRLAEGVVSNVGNAVLFPAPTNADIAARIATTRETVNRELSEMVETGLIEKHGRTLVIPDVGKLRRLSEDVAEH